MNDQTAIRRRALITIAIPIMVQNIIQHVMLLTDRAFLGHLNSRYLAAIGNVIVPYNALLLIFFSLSIGLIVLVAQNSGAQNYAKAHNLSESSFFFSTLISTGMFLLWFFGGREILTLFGAKGQILLDATEFVRILSIYLIFFGIDVTAYAIFQGLGQTKPIMIFGIVKSVLNIILDWLLIFGHWGFPALGLKGAALATMTANIIATLGIFITLLTMKDLPFRISWRSIWRPRWELYQQALKVGLPSSLESLSWNAGQLILARMLNLIDGMAIGIFSLVGGIQVVCLLIYLGFARASMTLVGQSWGEGNPAEARSTGLYCLKIGLYVSAFFTLVFMVFPHQIAGIFTTDRQVIERSIPLIRIIAITINFQAVNVMMGHAIRGMGDTKWMFYSQLIGTFFVISLSSYMIFGLSLGLIGVFLTVMMDELIRGAINLARFYQGKNPFGKVLLSLKAMTSRGRL